MSHQITEVSHTWTFSGTSGGGVAYNCPADVGNYSFYCEAGTGSSGTLKIQTARSTDGVWIDLGSTAVTLSTSASILQFNGPFKFVRPYTVEIPSTATLVVEMLGN